MKQNLNFGKMVTSHATAALHSDMFNNGVAEKYAMNNDSNNLKTYGGLYEWNELMNYSNASIRGLCPTGWHVSTDGEWKYLIQIAGGVPVGRKRHHPTVDIGQQYWFRVPLRKRQIDY